MMREQAIQRLRDILGKVTLQSADKFFREGAKIRDAKDRVLAKYQPLFHPESLDRLSSEDFHGFLLYPNNGHWDSLHRQGPQLMADMPRLREAMGILLDEGFDICTRLNRLRPSTGEPLVSGLGPAVITAILLVVYPEKYGVWNGKSQSAMKELGLWPEMPRGASFGERYVLMNRVLKEVAEELGGDLWTLDMLWWRVKPHMPQGAE